MARKRKSQSDDDQSPDEPDAAAPEASDAGAGPALPFALPGDLYAALTDKQQNALIALLHHPTVEQAATAAGVAKRTLYRWLTEKPFLTAYRRARRDSFTQAISLTQRYAPLAVNTLAKVMMNERAAPQSRISAAASILRFCREALSLDDLSQRIEALEGQARETLKPARGWRGF